MKRVPTRDGCGRTARGVRYATATLRRIAAFGMGEKEKEREKKKKTQANRTTVDATYVRRRLVLGSPYAGARSGAAAVRSRGSGSPDKSHVTLFRTSGRRVMCAASRLSDGSHTAYVTFRGGVLNTRETRRRTHPPETRDPHRDQRCAHTRAHVDTTPRVENTSVRACCSAPTRARTRDDG